MSPSKRRFYKTTLTVVVLSEEPVESLDLTDIAHNGVAGDYSVSVPDSRQEVLDGPAAAAELRAQHSDPDFFQLTEEGQDLEQDGEGWFDADFALTLHNGDEVRVRASGQLVKVLGDPYREGEVVMVPTVTATGGYHTYPHDELS
jgi:hypothetical protein